ncbi:MAG: flagellar biosynthesis protein FlhB [Spirochaetales bacterium]|jgi:flagellar biosynthetic protein FlhB|nr:flagellar biosynthesis protein FlhB [Spirochaetales bacterium]
MKLTWLGPPPEGDFPVLRQPLGAGPERAPAPDFFIHLQWFAAEDEGRTEEPTEQKIRKAREEGRVAKSQDITSAVVLLFAVLAFALGGRFMLAGLTDMMQFFLSRSAEMDVSRSSLAAQAFLTFFLRIVGPLAIAAFVAALAGNLIQVGFLFTTKTITPDLNRIVPRFGKWFSRSFVSSEAAFNFAKSLVKVIIIGIVAYINITGRLVDILGLVNQTFQAAISLVGGLTFRIMLQAAILMLIFALADYWFARRQYRESLKMSRQEVKEERKQSEGDPLVKNRLKERMMSLLTSNMWKNLPQADVVITNPTHYAVAMRYNSLSMAAPMVIAKGQDEIALRIRRTALGYDIPVIEDKPLARALYAEVDIGEVIPEKFYQAMILIIKRVYEMRGVNTAAV